jgi:hypothetical protein
VARFYSATVDLESDDVSLSDKRAAEWADYKQALDAVIDLDLDRLVMAGARRPVTRLDEAAVALFCAGWYAGLRAARAVSAGQGFAVPEVSRPHFHGNGRVWQGRAALRAGVPADVYPHCAGDGGIGTAGIR